MKVGILINKKKVVDETAINGLISLLLDKNFIVNKYYDAKDIKDDEVMLVCGGDGTILHSMLDLAKKQIKVIGINFGTVGFLSQFEKDETDQIVKMLLNLQDNKCSVIKRTILEVQAKGNKYYALNEVALHRSYEDVNGASMLKTRLNVNGEESDVISGDGVLVCTPTGSTAYSLSAGGAIIDPRTESIMITPICAFSLNGRSVVVPDNNSIDVQIMQSVGVLLVDGNIQCRLEANDVVNIVKSKLTLDFPVAEPSGFYKKIWRKLG